MNKYIIYKDFRHLILEAQRLKKEGEDITIKAVYNNSEQNKIHHTGGGFGCGGLSLYPLTLSLWVGSKEVGVAKEYLVRHDLLNPVMGVHEEQKFLTVLKKKLGKEDIKIEYDSNINPHPEIKGRDPIKEHGKMLIVGGLIFMLLTSGLIYIRFHDETKQNKTKNIETIIEKWDK